MDKFLNRLKLVTTSILIYSSMSERRVHYPLQGCAEVLFCVIVLTKHREETSVSQGTFRKKRVSLFFDDI